MRTFDPIASRVLLDDTDAVRGEAILGRPELVPGEEWQCEVKLTLDGVETVRRSHGEDAVQALILGLEILRLELNGKPVKWIGGEDHGFPRTVPAFFGLPFAKRIGDIIDAECIQFADDAKAKRLAQP